MGENSIPAELDAALRTAAGVNRLVVASDYDGCISPIVSRPQDAWPNETATAALRRASELPDTAAALVSGRALADLTERSGLADSAVTHIGSHGSEFDTGFALPVSDEQRALLVRVIDEFNSLAAQFPGVAVETKPVSTVLHVRNAEPDVAQQALEQARAGVVTWPGLQTTEGKAVLEIAVIETSKGVALDTLRERTDADAVLYLGDDVTDEKAFAHLHGRSATPVGLDVGIKVGAGETIADYRIADTDAVADVLVRIAQLRADR